MSDQNESSYEALLDRIQNRRWPKKGDRLLKESHDWERSVKISNDIISRHAHIWSGNMSAGAILISAYEENNPGRHYLIYPILFNYRHAIELAMKWIIFMYGGYSTVQSDNYKHHNLWNLWRFPNK